MSAQKTKPSGVLGAIVGLFSLSVLAGVLVTAMVTPALAVTGLTAQSSIGIFNNLPDYLTLEDQAQKNTIYALDNNQEPVQIAQIYHQNREEIVWEDVNDNVKYALLASEDRKFYEHGGINVASTIRAAISNVTSGSIQSGASTLTMQLVKNILIMRALDEPTEALRDIAYAEAQEQTIDRKLKEMKLAIGLEKRYTKNEIMLAYLNIAGFGGQTYGIQAAARQFFSVDAKDLTLPQAASLIAIVRTPSYNSLNDPENYEKNTKVRDSILRDMVTAGFITKAERDEAIATPLEVKLSPPKNGCLYATIGKFFCSYVEKLVPELESLGSTPEERAANWERGGYQIYTTLDYSQQKNAKARIAKEAPANEKRFKLGSAASVVEPGTGRILAMAQNKEFNNTPDGGDLSTTAVNYNTDRNYGGSSGFQVGSTYKIFTLVEWLQQGHGLNETVDARVKTYDQADFTAPCWPSTGEWTARNYGGAGGSISTSVMRATTGSINSAYAAMAFKLDLCKIRDTALSMGVHRADLTELQANPSSVLGTNEIAPLSMASAVATITAGGINCKPIAIDRIVDAAGEELPGQKAECERVMTPEVAAAAAYALRAVIQYGTAAGANPGGNVIGKTGTTDGAVQTWLVGGTTEAALAVWVGNIAGYANLGHYGLPNGNGNTARHRIFQNIMHYLNAEYGAGKEFPRPPARLLAGIQVTVPDVTGQTKEAAYDLLKSLGFVPQNGGVQPSGLDAGRIIYTGPRAGSKVSQGAVVYYYPSDGTLTETMPDVIGHDRDTAIGELTSAGFDPAKITVSYLDNPDPLASCTVAATTPAPGAATSLGAAITLKINRDESLPPGLCS